MIFLKQSTAVTLSIGPFLDDTDGKTAETALTLTQADVRLSKNGGAFAQKGEASSCTHQENGYYSCALNTTDTGTVGVLKLAVAESGALPVFFDSTVLPAVVYDSLIGGTDNLQVDMIQIDGLATNGNNATLNLKKLNIVNNTGDALVAQSTGSNGSGVVAVGQGSGAGLVATAGATGNGVLANGGGTSGDGIKAAATQGHGLELVGGALAGSNDGLRSQGAGTAGSGIAAYGNLAGSGLRAIAGNNGGHGIKAEGTGAASDGIHAEGGLTSGAGIAAMGNAGDSSAIAAVANGAGNGIYAKSLGTGHGLHAEGGNTSGHGVKALGGGIGDGLSAESGGIGYGISATGGATSGDGVRVQAANGHGLVLYAGAPTGSKQGIFAQGAGTSGSGIAAVGVGDGSGLRAQGAGVGNGMSLIKGASGKDLDADEIDNMPTSVWALGTRTLTSYGTLVADTVTAVWAALTSSMSVAGSIGKKLADWVLGSDSKVLISANAQDLSTTLDVRTKTITAGAITSSAFAAGAIDAAAIGTAAIDADSIASNAIAAVKIATGAITSAKFAAGAIDAAAVADNAIDAGAIATGAITNAKFAAGAIDAAAIAADAIGASEFSQAAADKVWGTSARTLTSYGTLVADTVAAIWNALTSSMSTAGSIGKKLADWVLGSDNKVMISSNAQDLSGSLDVNTKSMTAGAVTAAAIATGAIDADAVATDAVTEIAGGILATPANKLATNASGQVVSSSVAAGGISSSSFAANAVDANALAANAVDEITANFMATPANKLATDASGRVTVGSNADKTGYALTSGERSSIADAAWDEAIVDHLGAGSTGKALSDASGGSTLTKADVAAALKDQNVSAISPVAGSVYDDIQDNIDAVDSNVSAVGGAVVNVDGDLVAAKAVIDNINSDVDSGTYGLIALKNAINSIVAKLPSGNISDLSLSNQVDGIALSSIFELTMAMVNGRYRLDYPSVGQVTFYKRDNVTVLFTVNISDTERSRV